LPVFIYLPKTKKQKATLKSTGFAFILFILPCIYVAAATTFAADISKRVRDFIAESHKSRREITLPTLSVMILGEPKWSAVK
jgi:hypothetical protein